MLDKLWEFIIDASMFFFIPVVCSYLALTSNIFLNAACDEATGLEKWGNELLVPYHYLLVGQLAKRDADGQWTFVNRFDYMDGHFVAKTIASSLSALPSFFLGVTLKTLALLTQDSRDHHQSMYAAKQLTNIHSNHDRYLGLGIDLQKDKEWFVSQGHVRRPGDEKNMMADKECLRQIAALLDEASLPWWVDCGTCLGTYRYGGVIPWDKDIDIAVFLDDFDNVRRALNRLDPQKYIVQDWSSREHPQSYIKVYIRESRTLIDIYHFKILPETKQIRYLFSFEHHTFFPQWWVEREKKFTVPVAFDVVFPLKRAMFDGIEVNVPNNVEFYLRRYYGENLSPVKLYDPRTKKYEKDWTHPYWQQVGVH